MDCGRCCCHQGHCTHSFRGHKGIVLRVLFHPEPRRLLLFTASDDAEVKMWDLKSRSLLASLDGHFSAVTGLGVSPCGGMLLSAGRDKVRGTCITTVDPAWLYESP
jgi:U3 small nucleolar RNA-associated protein 13